MVNNSDHTDDEEIMASWYAYAADEPGFVGYWLGLLRERQSVTADEQANEFGTDEVVFHRLQAMPLPREQALARDAHRIAECCHLKNPIAFVQAMILARSLELGADRPAVQEFYQAAFDEEELE
ncbi:MAG TPA: hypothetical protein VJ464_14940 [Blastocatellia bacterium]|nr:hypothetical protein [Blastocatellia bacterium]